MVLKKTANWKTKTITAVCLNKTHDRER